MEGSERARWQLKILEAAWSTRHKNMSVYDRKYMQEEFRHRKDSSTGVSKWKRLLFMIWLLFHPKYW